MWWGLHADAWTAIAAWATLVVLGATAAIALWQVRQARSLQEEEARPVVVVDLDVDRHPKIIYMTFENYGRTSAHDVKVTFEPPLTTTIADGDFVGFFSNTFPTLAPGKRIVGVFDSSVQRLPRTDLPKRYTARAIYFDRRRRRFEDKFVLDLSVYEGRMSVTEKDIGDVVDNLKAIVDSIHGFESPYGGISVVTASEQDAAALAAERTAKSRQQHDRLSARLYPKKDAPGDA
jgi:hypothetical protein